MVHHGEMRTNAEQGCELRPMVERLVKREHGRKNDGCGHKGNGPDHK
jgi:hypothetical protein